MKSHKRKSASPSWVVISDGVKVGAGEVGEIAHCQRCGEKLILGLPLRLEAFAKMGMAFADSHSTCVERSGR